MSLHLDKTQWGIHDFPGGANLRGAAPTVLVQNSESIKKNEIGLFMAPLHLPGPSSPSDIICKRP